MLNAPKRGDVVTVTKPNGTHTYTVESTPDLWGPSRVHVIHTKPDGTEHKLSLSRIAWDRLTGSPPPVRAPVLRARRGKVVEVPPEWVGQFATKQERKKRQRTKDTKPRTSPDAYRKGHPPAHRPFRRTGRGTANAVAVKEQEE